MSTSDPCTECGEPTSFGSGRFVNRVPSDTRYICPECMMIECWECGKPIPVDEDFKDQNEEGFYHEECVPQPAIKL